MKFSSPESEYLTALIRAAIKNDSAPNPPAAIDWQGLVALSEKQQVYSLIEPVIDFSRLPQKQAEELKRYSGSELLRLVAMKAEMDCIEKALKENGICFMLLKGSVLRDLYPRQKMRQMSDIDILYDGEKRSSLVKMMKSLGFRLTATCEDSDDFFRSRFILSSFTASCFLRRLLSARNLICGRTPVRTAITHINIMWISPSILFTRYAICSSTIRAAGAAYDFCAIFMFSCKAIRELTLTQRWQGWGTSGFISFQMTRWRLRMQFLTTARQTIVSRICLIIF